MKNINDLKTKLEDIFAYKFFGVKDINSCSDEERYICSLVAETQAYLRAVIPEPYYKFSIKDFDGLSEHNLQVLEPKVAVAAKKEIVKYCWGNIPLDKINSMDQKELDNVSIINKRKSNCDNVVIYPKVKSFEQKGKTFCASLIMKEAIKSRVNNGLDLAQTYDWIEYAILEDMVRKQEESELSDIRSADWLVVEDIPYSSTRWKREMMNPFFIERIRDGLPTIFVFRFNVKQKQSEDDLGLAITKVIGSSRTCFIEL
jgi:hypothetical protein